MIAFVTWLLGTNAVPDSLLVWELGGVCTAVVLSALLLATVTVLAWQRDRQRGEIAPAKRRRMPSSGRELPRTA